MLDLQGYGWSILQGAVLTVEVALVSLLVAVVLGMLGALAKLSASRTARLVASVYTTVIRGIPDLVLMLLIFFGGQILVNQLALMVGYDGYVDVNPFVAGVLTIGSFSAHTWRRPFAGQCWPCPTLSWKRVTRMG